MVLAAPNTATHRPFAIVRAWPMNTAPIVDTTFARMSAPAMPRPSRAASSPGAGSSGATALSSAKMVMPATRARRRPERSPHRAAGTIAAATASG